MGEHAANLYQECECQTDFGITHATKDQFIKTIATIIINNAAFQRVVRRELMEIINEHEPLVNKDTLWYDLKNNQQFMKDRVHEYFEPLHQQWYGAYIRQQMKRTAAATPEDCYNPTTMDDAAFDELDAEYDNWPLL